MRNKAKLDELEESDRVIIRVWSSYYSKTTTGRDVGHVSIEIPSKNMYCSLWPQEHRVESGVLSPVQPEFKQNYPADFAAESRSPETTICLYGLDYEKMSKEFDNIKTEASSGELGWVLIGANKAINSGKGESCASLAWRLLKIGKIYDEISKSWSKGFSFAITPDMLCNAIIAAKKYELDKHPETKAFQFSEEYDVSSRAKFCLVM